mgnify:CR=1 FL=1
MACAAALATQQIYQQENLFQKAIDLEPYWQEALFSLRDLPNVIDIRTVGLVAGIQFAAHADGVGKRGYEVFRECFENGLLVRASGDTIALSPALIVEKAEIDRLWEALSAVPEAELAARRTHQNEIGWHPADARALDPV